MSQQPYSWLKAAAAGDNEAMRELSRDCAETARTYGDWSALTEALLLARMVYAATEAASDGATVLDLLNEAIADCNKVNDVDAAEVLLRERQSLAKGLAQLMGDG